MKTSQVFGKMMWGQLVWFGLMRVFNRVHCLVFESIFISNLKSGSLLRRKTSGKLECNYQYLCYLERNKNLLSFGWLHGLCSFGKGTKKSWSKIPVFFFSCYMADFFFFFLINILILFLKDAVFSFCLWKLHSWWQIQLIFSLSFHLTQKNLISNLNPISYISDFAYLILQSVPLYFILALRVHCFLLPGDKYLLCDASLWDTPSS